MTTAEITPDEAAALTEMREELEAFTNIGGMVRCAVSKNAPWYRRFCARHASSRFRKNTAFDTKIKRRDTLRVLGALCDGKPTASQYVPEILGEARARVRANPAAYAVEEIGSNPF